MAVASPLAALRPPARCRDAAVGWVLAAAFGPGHGAGSRDEDRAAAPAVAPEGAWERARSLGVAPRIGARDAASGRPLLAGLPGGFRDDHRRAVAQDLQRDALLEALREVAAAIGRPCVWLKSAALAVEGRLLPGARPAADLDVLVREADGAAFLAALAARGFHPWGSAYAHQWPALRPPHGAMTVELHRSIPGLRAPRAGSPAGAARFARFEDLDRAGALGPDPVAPQVSFVPSAGVCGAHAAVHAWRQHLWAPRAHPPLVSVADLLDLGFAGERRAPLRAEAAAWTRVDLGDDGWEALDGLLAALAAGRSLDAPDLRPETGAGRLLDHAVAGALDPDYARSLETRWLAPALVERPGWRSRLASLGGWLGAEGWAAAPRRIGRGWRRWRAARAAGRRVTR